MNSCRPVRWPTRLYWEERVVVGLEYGAQSKGGWPAVNNNNVRAGRQAITLRSEGSNLRSWHKASTPAAGS